MIIRLLNERWRLMYLSKGSIYLAKALIIIGMKKTGGKVMRYSLACMAKLMLLKVAKFKAEQ